MDESLQIIRNMYRGWTEHITRQLDRQPWTIYKPAMTYARITSFRYWKQTLSQMYLQKGKDVSTRTKNLVLQQDLGPWTQKSEWLQKNGNINIHQQGTYWTRNMQIFIKSTTLKRIQDNGQEANRDWNFWNKV